MALATKSKAELRALAYLQYGEDATSNPDFTSTAVNTFVQDAVQEFVLRSDCLVASARCARPSQTTAGARESLITLLTGMYSVTRVYHLRRAGANANWRWIAPRTPEELVIRYGAGWMGDSEATSGTASDNHGWYRAGPRRIGFYPPKMSATAGTVVLWGHRIPELMTASGGCEVPPEFYPGVVAIACRKMAERDADADTERERFKEFESIAESYTQKARGYRPADRED